MIDIIFCSIPYSNLDQIYSAPAILRGVVEQHGYTARTKDFGCTLLNLCDRDVNRFNRVQSYFISPGKPDPDIQKTLDQYYQSIVDYFQANPSRYIGLSVFSSYTHKATIEILQKIKQANIKSKIIAGGRGLSVPIFAPVKSDFVKSSYEGIITIEKWLHNRQLIDHGVIGDGEDALLSIMQGNNLSSITADHSDQFRHPMPNYQDYKLQDYLFGNGKVMLPITGSKGCVRDCDFCNVKSLFGRYRYRSGSDVANEMIELSRKYQIYKFQFTDSLVNGGFKPFMEFLQALSEYNLTNPDVRIAWTGQYISRPQKEIPTKYGDYYQLLKNSGAEGLTIGAESGSNEVLKNINKKTTVEDLFDELEQFRKHNITCFLLFFSGHWSETWENFKEHCEMIVNLTPYVRSGTISAVHLGTPMMMADGTPAVDNAHDNGIVFSEFNKSDVWYVKNNPTATFKERIYRRLIVDCLIKKLRIPSVNDYEMYLNVKNIIDHQYQDINQFYHDHDLTTSI
jgi:hypothetical protein